MIHGSNPLRLNLLRIAYNGSNFAGSQRQPGQTTVESVVLDKVRSMQNYDPSARYIGAASRTDRNVSALSNVIAIESTRPVLPSIFNGHGGNKDVWAWAHAEVPLSFNPRYTASKTYRYFWPKEDSNSLLKSLQERAAVFCGKHDFRWFSKTDERNSIREIFEIHVLDDRDSYMLEIRGKSFVWQQVRRIATAIFDRPDLSIIQLRELLAAPHDCSDPRIRPAAPQGLVLYDVQYSPPVSWQIDSDSKRRMESYYRGQLNAAIQKKSVLQAFTKQYS